MWFTAAAQLLGSELQTVPLDTRNPYLQQQRSSPWGTVALVLGGLAAVGGVYYFAVKR